MNEKEIVAAVMKDEGVTQIELARKLQWSSQQVVGNKLTRQTSMRVEDFVRMLDAMGYEVIVKKGIGKSEVRKVEL